MKKICPHCKNEFWSNHARRIYCSDSHRISAYNKRKGFQIAIVPPKNEETGLKGLKNNIENEKNNEQTTNDFGKNILSSTTGYIAGEFLKNIFTLDENKNLTKKDGQIILNEIVKIQQVYENRLIQILDERIKYLDKTIKNM